MNRQPFTTVCSAILGQASKSIPAAYRAQLTHDDEATSDKGKRETAMFSIWGEDQQGFWHRGYCSYSIVYDPHKLLGEGVPFQVRFVYFHNRKENSKGQFNDPVHRVLSFLDGQNGFIYAENKKTFRVFHPYDNPTATPQWQRAAAKDLEWLIAWTLPAFTQMLGSQSQP